MMPADRAENTKIVFLYVKSFEWVDPMGKEDNEGHPMAGTVYRAVHNADTDTYRLLYENKNPKSKVNLTAIFIPNLVVKSVDETTKEPGYTSEIIEITRKNILSFNLPEKVLDKIIEWQEDTELKKDLGLKKQPEQQKISPAQVIAAVQKQAEDNKMVELGSMMVELRAVNEPLYDVMQDIVGFALERGTSWVDYNKTLGAGKNIGAAVEALDRYSSEDRRTNLLEEDLSKAIHALLLEAGRRKVHNIE